MSEFARPARIEEVKFFVASAHGRAAPDAPIGMLENRTGWHGLEPLTQVNVIAESG
jgi:hypothetical protein